MKYQPPYGSPGADDPYVNGDPTIARQGSIIPAQAVEHPQREIVELIEKSGIAPADTELNQLTYAARRQFINFCVDSGAANAMSVALDPPLNSYSQGMPLRVLVAHNNTGPTTINVNSVGNRPVVRADGAQLQPNDLRAGMIALLVDDGTKFQMVNFQGFNSNTITTNTYTIHIPYVQDTGSPNALVANFSPAITTFNNGDLILVRVAYANTGGVLISINATGNYNLLRNDGQPLQSKDLIPGECILLEWNINYWQMMHMVRSQVYMKLTADLTLYIRTDGNDANDGSQNDAAHAFLHIQAAVEYVRRSFLISGRTVVLQLGIPGTYSGPGNNSLSGNCSIEISNLPGSIVIKGDDNNPSSYILMGSTNAQTSYPSCIAISGSGTDVTCAGVTFSNQSDNNHVVQCFANATIRINNCNWSGLGTIGAHVATFNGAAWLYGYFHTYSQASAFLSSMGGDVHLPAWFSLTNTHGINFSRAFIDLFNAYGEVDYGFAGFTGGASGPHFNIVANSVLLTNGPQDFLPGNQPGQSDSSSVYYGT